MKKMKKIEKKKKNEKKYRRGKCNKLIIFKIKKTSL
jgi:hypothetical protein